MVARQRESGFALLASLLGLAALLDGLFGPDVTAVTVVPGSAEARRESHGLLREGLDRWGITAIALIVGLLAGIAIGGAVDGTGDRKWARGYAGR